MQEISTRARAAGGWLFLVALIILWSVAPAGSAAKKAATVTVGNTTANPVPVAPVTPALEPVSIAKTIGLNPGESTATDAFDYVVPAGKRLVVETVSAGTVAANGQAVTLGVQETVGNQSLPLGLLESSGASTTVGRCAGPCRFYVEPGTSPTASIDRVVTSGPAVGRIILIGYLQPL